MTVADAFRATYEMVPQGIWSAPGRVNLIGEHTDYNEGFVLPFAIGARTSVAAAMRDDGVLRMRSAQQPAGDASVHLHEVAPGHPAGWSAYVAGVVWAARRLGHDVGGMNFLIDGRVPPGSGLSSSHALECAVAMAVSDMWGLGLSAHELAELARLAENDFVGAPTGLMDQMASLLCTRGHALFLDIRTLDAEQVPLDTSSASLALLVIDTRVHHSHGDGSYGDRRAACEKAARELGVGTLRDVAPVGLSDRLRGLDDELRKRARHVVAENARVVASVDALRVGDWGRLGSLMSASHESLRDDFEVSCDELDVAVAASTGAGALGARMTGGGFGGSAIAIVPESCLPDVRRDVTEAFATHGWTSPSLFLVAPSRGARREA